MKYVKQVGIIWGFTVAGELLHAILPLPVPSGVYGLFLLLGALMAGWVRLESVEGTGNFLMDTMTLMFIPAMVGLMEYAAQIKEVFVPFMIVIAVSTVAVMVVTGRVAQTVIDLQEHGRGKRAEERRGNSAESRVSAVECRENAVVSRVSGVECRENTAEPLDCPAPQPEPPESEEEQTNAR